MIKELIKLANHLDSIGYTKEASYIDNLLHKKADQEADKVKHAAHARDAVSKAFGITVGEPTKVVKLESPVGRTADARDYIRRNINQSTGADEYTQGPIVFRYVASYQFDDSGNPANMLIGGIDSIYVTAFEDFTGKAKNIEERVKFLNDAGFKASSIQRNPVYDLGDGRKLVFSDDYMRAYILED